MPWYGPFGLGFGGDDASTKNANADKAGLYNEPLQGDSLTRAVRSEQNFLTNTGRQAWNTGQQNYAQGLAALSPVLQHLTSLVRGDQADISQAVQPEANRIRDSFAAARDMISSQPRGGGKAGVLAEQPFKEKQAIADIASQKREAAPGQLGAIASTLAGLGEEEATMGGRGLSEAAQMMLARRGQNMGPGSFASQFNSVSQGLSALI